MRLFGKTQDRVKATIKTVTSTVSALEDAHVDGELREAVKRIISEQGINVAKLAERPEALRDSAALIRNFLPPPLRLVVRPKRVESILLKIAKKPEQSTSSGDAEPGNE